MDSPAYAGLVNHLLNKVLHDWVKPDAQDLVCSFCMESEIRNNKKYVRYPGGGCYTSPDLMICDTRWIFNLKGLVSFH